MDVKTVVLYVPAYVVAGIVALTVLLYMVSLATPKAAFVARCLASYLCPLGCALFGVFASVVMRVFGHGQSAQWAVARAFKWSMALATGVTFSVRDPGRVLATVRPAVFIGNHQTELDVLMLGCMFPPRCSVTAKSSLRNVPFLGWFMTLSGSVFIDRKNTRDARQAMAGAAEQMRRMGQSVYMFPEGTRSYAKDPVLLPFKKGAFHLAVQAQVPIVPVVVANYSHILWIKDWIFNSGTIPVKVLDPIPTTGLTSADVEALTTSTRELMLKELIALTEEARERPLFSPVENGKNGVAQATAVEAVKVAA